MSFWKRKRSREPDSQHPEEHAIRERHEQKVRSMHADEDYYRAMRRLALEAHDAQGVRHYDQKLRDLEMLKYEFEVLSDDPRRR